MASRFLDMPVQISDLVSNSEGIDAQATVARYCETLRARLEEAFPDADIRVYPGAGVTNSGGVWDEQDLDKLNMIIAEHKLDREAWIVTAPRRTA